VYPSLTIQQQQQQQQQQNNNNNHAVFQMKKDVDK